MSWPLVEEIKTCMSVMKTCRIEDFASLLTHKKNIMPLPKYYEQEGIWTVKSQRLVFIILSLKFQHCSVPPSCFSSDIRTGEFS